METRSIHEVDPDGVFAQRLYDAILSDGPAGANPANQQFPEGFDEWPEERKNEWFDGTARATYMAQCHHLDQIRKSVDATLSDLVDSVKGSSVGVLAEIQTERDRQDSKWGGENHDDGHSVGFWVQLIKDYAGWARVMAGMGNIAKTRRRLIQVATIAVAAVQSIDRKYGNPPPEGVVFTTKDRGVPE